MAENGSILVTGAAGQLGAVGRTVTGHLVTMGALHRADRYDRLADGVERVTGRPAMSVRAFVALHAEACGGRRSSWPDQRSEPHSGRFAR